MLVTMLMTLRCLAALLDASKAFDRVNHSVLFEKLFKGNLPPCIVRTLLTWWYSCQKVTVKWNTCYSSKFPVTNGVRQGGILSPTLFTIYILTIF